MSWVKIRHHHVPINMTNTELGMMVKFQLEVARIGRAMTEDEKRALFGRKEVERKWESLKRKHQICEDLIVKHVLDDHDYEDHVEGCVEDYLRGV